MRISLDVEMKDRLVCILGAGKVSLRKTKQLLQAGAQVTIGSLSYDAGFDGLEIDRVSEEKLYALLPSAFMAIACTDDKEANRKFLSAARKAGAMAVSAQKDTGEDAWMMMRTETDEEVLACHTQGGFPLAGKRILHDWEKRLSILKDIREQLPDKSLSGIVNACNDVHLYRLHQAVSDKKIIVYLLHGNDSARAGLQCRQLENLTYEQWHAACMTFFLAPKYKDIELKELCVLLDALQIRAHFVLLFWEEGRYFKQAAKALKGRSVQWIRFDPESFIGPQEIPILHTRCAPANGQSVVISMLDSAFLRRQYPGSRFVAVLDQKEAVERICYEINPGF